MRTSAERVPGRFESLTSLRFAAALGVFALHSHGLTNGRLADAYRWISEPGPVGVSFFFILSGFVLTWAAVPAEPRRAIYRRRFARIYPAYLVALLAGLALSASLDTTTSTRQALAASALVQAWIPDLDYVFAVNGPSWTLSCEAFFYATFPLYCGWMLRLDRRTRWILLGVAIASVFVLGGSLAAWVAASDGGSAPDVALWLFVHLPLARLPEFVAGALLAAQLRDGGLPALRIGPALLLSALAYGLVSVAPAGVNLAALTIVPFLVLLAAAATSDAAGAHSWMHHPWLVHLGKISYCFYLVHELVLRALSNVLGGSYGGLRGAGVLALALVLCVLAGDLLHRLVERPLERWLRTPVDRARRRPALPGP